MRTKGLLSPEQIDIFVQNNGGFLNLSDDINEELNLKKMCISCFTYGGISAGSYYFNNYLLPYKNSLGEEVFNGIMCEMNEYLSKCTIIHGVYTDSEGCTYNSIKEIQ